MTDLFDYARSAKVRDIALDTVLRHNAKWSELVLAYIEGLPKDWVGLAEDIRRLWPGPPPDHHNAWGAITRIAVESGMLVQIGSGPMTAEKSHARSTPRYRRT